MANSCVELRLRWGGRTGCRQGWKSTSCGGMGAGIHGAATRREQQQPIFVSY